MQSLPAEILDMILNGLDADGVPFLDPLWRFAARATHPTWRHTIDAAASTNTRTHVKALSRAWRVPCDDGRGYVHNCQCAYSTQHGDFKTAIASGRIVSARCAIGRPWVMAWCLEGSVPQQDRAMVALFTLPTSATDVAAVRRLVGPYVEGDESTGPWPVCPLRRDFWCYIERVPPEERGDDAYDPGDSEFLNDVLFFAPEWNRSDIVRSLLAAYPAPGVVDTVLLHACLYDDAQLVDYALVHAYQFCRDKDKDDDDKTVVPHVRGMWKKAAKSSGAHVLERFLDLCARYDQHDQSATADDAKDGRDNGDCTEADISRMVRLARPKTDLVWQKCAARCGNIDALLVGERYGVSIQVHELIEAANDWGNHTTVQWLLKRAPTTPDPLTAGTLVRACALVLSGIVADVDSTDPTSSAYDQCTCRKRRRSKASTNAIDGRGHAQVDQDGDACTPEIRATIDALCETMSPIMATDDGVATARQFISMYLNRDRHTPDGVSTVVRVIEHWRVFVAARIKPLGWGTLIRTAIATGAVGAVDRIVDLIVAWSSCDLTGIDAWAIATDQLGSAIREAMLPMPLLNCGKCPKRSLFYQRDRAAAMQSHMLGVIYGTISVGEAAERIWQALCRPRPLAATALGDPAHDSPLLASLRASMHSRGLVLSQ
ncbi:hypothetical protein pneo_cds_208 [Pandoravirus neocaledonia]|uniref:F-box incomplete domain containing protein n=1 Tax=Pandoravirus neocaledonia TaxID=2107708 RepID=A0A2U7UBT2_9VIRU|nr:hypothetical protein pneo_cds_208 [Pandoravirus neocaledonia]AVK75815.1 hypothetical protein pneo_cds_208 [Pandoravirus neocaledonia]